MDRISKISRPANRLVWVKKEPSNSAPSNQTQRVEKEPNPALLTQSVKKESRNQTQKNPANSAPANQLQWVKKERGNSSSEVSSSKNVVAEKASQKTRRLGAEEKGKAKVEETQDLGEGKKTVKKRNRRRNRKPRAQEHIKLKIATILEEENMAGGQELGSCMICEQGLAPLPSGYENRYDEDEDEDEEYDYYFEAKNLPEVGVLECGHCYHTQCLEDITPDDLISDPPCLICLS